MKIRNESQHDLEVPSLGNRLVLAGAVVDVPDEDAPSFICQSIWAEVKSHHKTADEAEKDEK